MKRSYRSRILVTAGVVLATQAGLFLFGVFAAFVLSLARWQAVLPEHWLPWLLVVQLVAGAIIVWASRWKAPHVDPDVELNVALVLILCLFPAAVLLDWVLFLLMYKQ